MPEPCRQAQARGVCRQRLYREHAAVVTALTATAAPPPEPQRRLQELRASQAAPGGRLRHAVALDRDKQQEFARVAQAVGVGLATAIKSNVRAP
jgi:hypothetical protein